PLAILAAAAAGALWGFIPGLLKATRGVHEVIVTIMLNYTALYSANAVVRHVLTDNRDSTEIVPDSASLSSEWLQSMTDFLRLHYGIVVSLFIAVVFWFIIECTIVVYALNTV